MLLHCTLVRSPCATLQKPPVELTVEFPARAAGADLQAELAAKFGAGGVCVDGRDISSLTLGKPPLVNGAVLVDAADMTALKSRQRTPDQPANLALAVHSGAGAGLVVPLRRGSYTIGRSNAEITIPDADLSRAHARLVITETAITIMDLGSANGTDVDGERRRNAVITTRSTIRCGNSTMSLVFLKQPGNPLDKAGTDVHEPLIISRRHDAVNRAALLLTAVLPLIIGVGLAVITGMWLFLAFTAVSAISILVPVLSGRRQRRELAAAVSAALAEDQERRRRAAPPLSALVIAGATERNPGADVTDHAVWLRLGQSIQQANVQLEQPDPGRAIPSAGLLPFTLDPARPLTTFRGHRDSVDGLVRSILMQLAGYPLGAGTRVLIHGTAHHLPLAARFLDGVTLSSHNSHVQAVLTGGFSPSRARGVLIILGGPGDTAEIIDLALKHEWQILDFSCGDARPLTADVELHERTAVFNTGTARIRFAPDLAPAGVFDTFCRRVARDAGADTPGGGASASLPLSCRLTDLLPASAAETARRWRANSRRTALTVPIGLSVGGPRMLDLQADGPHLLVAGTTGSGKSEFLRSLTAGLALSYPPDRVNFLFVDFKGGSGLGPLTGLPHCVGMLTDLGNHELDRYLQSLRAEIRFREEALAAAQAPDLVSYRAAPAGLARPLPHLVIVIDEFRMLVEDASEALRELMRIAAIGRSLGIHLVMATQRPQGALTADIRANVTTSVALRVQSEMESTDIINSNVAARIRVDTPGRAYLGRGSEDPAEFQACSLTAGALNSGPRRLSVHVATGYIDGPPASGESGPAETEPTPAQATTPLVSTVATLWNAMDGTPARKPVADPLPHFLTEPSPPADLDAGSFAPGSMAHGWSVGLGQLDLPSEQKLAPLIWEPASHGHLGLIGGPESGVAEAIRLAVSRLAAHPHESHLYILDPDSAFASVAPCGRVGARVGLHELRRAVRVLERVAQEQSRRLAGHAAGGTPLVLVIAGWGSWSSAFRSGPLAWAEDLVHDLIRDGGGAGITVIISGQRELVTARFFAAIPNRIYFPAGSSEESRIAWPKVPATAAVAGRGVAMGALAGGRTAVCQFYTPTCLKSDEPAPGVQPRAPAERPFRIEPLPALVSPAQLLGKDPAPGLKSAAAPFPAERTPWPGQKPGFLLLGVGGDELEPVSVGLPPGGVLAVLGGPSSGKTSFLRLLPQLNPGAGPWFRPHPGTDAAAYWSEVLGRAAGGSLPRGTVALVDNADLLPQEVNRTLAELNARGVTVVMTAGYSPVLSQRVPLALQARALGTGLLIAPRTFLDGDLFGVRFETEPSPPPGRSILIRNGRALAIQLAWASGGPSAATYSAGGKPPVRDA